MELENEGSSGSKGSHWERRILNNEVMVPVLSKSPIFSAITAALYEDSGWYTVDYSYTVSTDFGKNRGCDFLSKKCVNETSKTENFPEFCSQKGKAGCSDDFTALAYCKGALTSRKYYQDPDFDYFKNKSYHFGYFDNCPYYKPVYPHLLSNCLFSDGKTGKNFTFEQQFGVNSRCFTGTWMRTENITNENKSLILHNGCLDVKVESLLMIV